MDAGTAHGGYLRTNEHEEAVRSLEFAQTQARLILSDPYHWKWVLISLHNAVQGLMVLALWNGNGLLSLRDKDAEKWLEAYRNDAPYPSSKLDNFMNLYKKTKDKSNFATMGSEAFRADSSHNTSMKRLNDFRNDFIHFTPKGWSLELAGLPRVCIDALDIVRFFGWLSTAILWHNEKHSHRLKQAADSLLRSMMDLEAAYIATGQMNRRSVGEPPFG
jgi:hypothetical protein